VKMESNLTENEREFKKMTIDLGEALNLWTIDEFIGGGSRQFRTAFGLDYTIHSQDTGVQEKIEYKKENGTNICFTKAELKRFLITKDKPKEATRLCAILMSRRKNDKIAIGALYWSPKFLQILPKQAFHFNSNDIKKGTIAKLSLRGLDSFIKQNLENTLLEWEGNIATEFVNYKYYRIPEIMDWFFRKIQQTMKNPLEEEKKDYEACEYIEPTEIALRGKLDEVLLEIARISYRPLYLKDFKRQLPFYPQIWREIRKDKRGGKYIFGSELDEYLRGRLVSLQKRIKNFIAIWIDGYKLRSWWIDRQCTAGKYIPLQLITSEFLDILRQMYLKTGGRAEFTTMDIGKILKISQKRLRKIVRAGKGRESLEKNELIEVETVHSRKPVLYKLTKRCINYITRKDEFYNPDFI